MRTGSSSAAGGIELLSSLQAYAMNEANETNETDSSSTAEPNGAFVDPALELAHRDQDRLAASADDPKLGPHMLVEEVATDAKQLSDFVRHDRHPAQTSTARDWSRCGRLRRR